MEQVRQMPAGSHRQPLCNPTDRDRGLRPEPGREVELEEMALAPRCELSFGDAADSQSLRYKALGLGLGRLGKLRPIVPLAPLLLDVLEHLRPKRR